MSPTRKPKPPDKGAPPEHKPSRKVALEEVLRSLQDLVSNELATEPVKPASEAETVTAKTNKSRAAQEPSATPAAITTELPPVIPPAAPESTAEPVSSAIDHQIPTQPATTVSSVVDELPDLGAEPPATSATPATTDSKVPAEGLQQELPYLEDIPFAPAAKPPAPTPAAAEFQMPELTLEDLPPENLPLGELPLSEVKSDLIAENSTPTDLAPAPTIAATPAAVEETNWDDIPVLEEAVDLAEEVDAENAVPGVGVSASTMLPPTDAARRLAIQVAARLNVELRKSGQAGLSSDIITRLARLLQEALAKGAANMENSPPDKH
jgi:hypothetical protein